MVDLPASGSLSRRLLIVGGAAGLAGLVASGCDVNNPVDDEKEPKATAELAPDVAVATSALAEIRALSTAVSSTLTRFPATRTRLASLVTMHRAHEESLADAVPERARATATAAPYVVPRRPEVALGKLAARERRLHGTLDGLALRAQSGDFARLLASMGAAVGQQLAVWEP